MTDAAPQSPKLKLLLLAALFLLPVVLSVTLFALDWRPSRTNNYGELISPVRHLDDVALRTVDAKPFVWSTRPQKWALVRFVGERCDAECATKLHQMRQIHLAQGKERDRLERILIAANIGALAELRAQYPDMTVLTGAPDVLQQLAHTFSGAAPVPSDTFLVDPLNNVMMRYRADADPSGIRKDVKHLLKISKGG